MMLYKRHKRIYERIIMNDDWADKGCGRCKYYDICTHTHVLPPSSLDLGLFTRERELYLQSMSYVI